MKNPDVKIIIAATIISVASSVGIGCWKAVPAIQPVADLGVCIATDVSEGKTLSQIISDCGGDVAAIVVAILGSTDQTVLASKAHGEALQLQFAMSHPK